MVGFIDIHSHIMPFVDDGAQTEKEAISMLQIAYDEGIRHIIATPHYHNPYIGKEKMSDSQEVQEGLDLLMQHAKNIADDFHVSVGNELYYGIETIEQLKGGHALPLAGSRYVLVEFSPGDDFDYIKNGLNHIIHRGYRPILAHVERYDCMVEAIKYVEEIVNMGVYVQVNASSVLGEFGGQDRKFVKKLMKQGLMHFIGTDAHSNRTRAPRMKKCAEYIAKKFGQGYAEELMIDNPGKILENKAL